jgi:hypothetical protein
MATPVAMPPAMNQVQSALDYQFSNLLYLAEALRAAGSGYNMNPSITAIDGHKRLALVGSAIMRAAILSQWYTSGAQRGWWPYFKHVNKC